MSLGERFALKMRAGLAGAAPRTTDQLCNRPKSFVDPRPLFPASHFNSGSKPSLPLLTVARQPDIALKRSPNRSNQTSTVSSSAAEAAFGMAQGKKSQARDILAAVRVLNTLDDERRRPTTDERATLARFGGFGSVALSLFPDPATGNYKDGSWQGMGEELRSLLSPDDYASAKRTTFNAFYTSPVVVGAMHRALQQLGVSSDSLVLEPGCGIGNFIAAAPAGMRFIGIEQDRTSGRIAQVLHSDHDIRIENFRDTPLPENSLDAVIGNVPFANVRLSYRGMRLALHDFFLAKSLDALKPGGVLSLVTSRFTLDKLNDTVRGYIAEQADFLGAIRLPADAFYREGTAVVSDILFLGKRAAGKSANHVDAQWLETGSLDIGDGHVTVNRYFLRHPEMVLGDWSKHNRLYGVVDDFSIRSNGNLAEQLDAAIERLPKREPTAQSSVVIPLPTTAPLSVSALHAEVAEGSFLVADDQTICQKLDSQPVPVVYCGVALKADGTMTGRRLAALIQLRDLSRRVLASQNEGHPEAERTKARRCLNAAYDTFVAAYGPINKTTLSQTGDGGLIRRMPNLVKFREDPDAMLVMSLEHYDEWTGTATKAPIMHQDVVGSTPPVTSVSSAEEGLLVSLDQRGVVDLPFITGLYGKTDAQVVDELGDLIYREPESNVWLTADAYLSGNVRAKLAVAQQAGREFARNVAALQLVQPDDVLPGDIDANLGAPWIPASDIQAFGCELFRVAPTALEITHFPKDAVWNVEANYETERSVAATSEFGTARANGSWLLGLALNMKTPTIYDTIDTGKGEERVVNQEATGSAREKLRALKERFRAWVFADPDRTERLVRVYNDTYNSLQPRLFDGSHLAFPGMNRTIQLHPHQKNAVWRGMTGGNTLLAHAVGAGKTYTMAATGMKLKQTGLIQKPMFVVPNHMLEQFSREFLQLYPNAKLLVATKDDLAKDRRKLLTAKIASGRWDGIIVTHSSFERIGMSRRFKEAFLREQIAEYERLLCDHAGDSSSRGRRNLIKIIEKQKAQREARLKDLLAEDKKDDGLNFDDLGVDHLFVDEAHFFKNLETATKMDRVAGIQTAGSERAFDLLMKTRYLDQKHAGHGVVFATGTPISNTMVETYTLCAAAHKVYYVARSVM